MNLVELGFYFSTLSCLGVLVYHYFLYPILLYVFKIIFPRPLKYSNIVPRVSLIITAYNEDSVIRDKIINSLQIDYPNLEIIINSEGSTDQTARIVHTYRDKGIIGLHSKRGVAKRPR